MSDAQMTVTVGANVQGAVAGLNQVNQAAQQTGQTIKKVQPSVIDTTNSLNALSEVSRNVPQEFSGISNSVGDAVASFARLKIETGSTSEALRGASTSMSSAGGIGIALAAAVAVAAYAYNKLSIEAQKTAEKNKELVKSAEDWEKGISDINKGIADEASKISVIVGLLDKGTLSRKEQKSAIEELIKLQPEYFGGLNKEKTSIDAINLSYQTYLANLDKEFEAKSLDIKLQDLFNKRLDIQENLKQYDQLADRIKQVRQALAQGPSRDSNGVPDLAKFSSLSAELTTLQKQFGQAFNTAFGGNILSGESALSKINKQISDLIAQRVELGNKGIIPAPGDKEKSALDLLKDQRSELQKQLALLQEIDKAGKLPTFRQGEIANLQTRILSLDAVIDKLPQVNVEIKEDIIQEALDKKLKALPPFKLDKGEVFIDTGSEFELTNVRDARKGLEDRINTQLAANPMNLKPSVTITKLDIDTKIALQALSRLNSEIRSSIENAFEGLGDTIATSLSGGGLQDAFQSFGQIIAGFFQSIGKALIAYSATLLLAKTAIKSLNPYVALAAGILIEAAGSALRGSLKQTPFATGGIVTGPTNALIGEAGPEVVFPLNQLNRFVKGIQGSGNAEMRLTGQISGNNLRLLIDRANRSNNIIN
jgi:hypothetical protein